MSRLVDIDDERFWDVLFDEACVEGKQAERIKDELGKIVVFDVEKIIKQLEEVDMKYFLTIANTGSEKLDIAYGYASDSINKAIDIVKKGGVRA